jgi:hypothetical protein
MSERARAGGLVGPVLLIGLGLIILMNNLGVLNWSVWDMLFRLWPLILITIGLDFLIGRRSVWGSLLALVLIVAVFIVGVFLMDTRVEASFSTEKIRHSLGDTTSAEISISPAVGFVRVNALSQGTSNLIEGDIRVIRGEKWSETFDTDKDPIVYAVKSQRVGWVPSFGIWEDTASWDVGLNPQVQLNLDVSLGVGKSELDLGGLILTDLDADIGVGKLTVTLPNEGQFRAHIDSAIGETFVIIPRGMAARIRVSTGLGTSQMPAGYSRQGDYYISPGYGTAENRIDLEISQAIGLIRVISIER